ncbi:heavy metal resistance protein [Croceibacterium mercuriale]|uniref:Heavy metal resistance protein n=1 Tax=Croceibacterium mercuriale TaxID=1572751 RepID=A0A0B2BYV1_9SPHN|nr:periplasmic heavy metal sensor [Croceibacterium mercuriale]KHL26634.1 heavy metal resistance protein [Croceibacterium mercuriale]
MSTRTFLIVFAAFVAAVGGVLLGRELFAPSRPPGSELHRIVHDELALNPTQDAQLTELERAFAVKRRALEEEMRADNARLAAAIEAEHGYGPRVAQAVDRSHAAMGELQKETLAHMFAMRQILRPDQAEKFDRAVVKALTQDRQ